MCEEKSTILRLAFWRENIRYSSSHPCKWIAKSRKRRRREEESVYTVYKTMWKKCKQKAKCVNAGQRNGKCYQNENQLILSLTILHVSVFLFCFTLHFLFQYQFYRFLYSITLYQIYEVREAYSISKWREKKNFVKHAGSFHFKFCI